MPTPNTLSIRRTFFYSFLVGAISSLFASLYYRSLEQKNYQITLVLSLLVALAVAVSALLQLAIHLRRMRLSERGFHPTIVVAGTHERKQFGHILKDVQSEVCFLGILAKRTVNSDG